MPHLASRERSWREQWTHFDRCGKDEFSELADANGVYRMKRSRSRGGIRLISGDMSEEFEPKSEPVLDGVEGGERPGLGAFLVRRRGSVWSSTSSGGREESPAGDGGTYLLSRMVAVLTPAAVPATSRFRAVWGLQSGWASARTKLGGKAAYSYCQVTFWAELCTNLFFFDV